jgi:spore germination cell wall hydrolase CwlJ-like protein
MLVAFAIGDATAESDDAEMSASHVHSAPQVQLALATTGVIDELSDPEAYAAGVASAAAADPEASAFHVIAETEVDLAADWQVPSATETIPMPRPRPMPERAAVEQTPAPSPARQLGLTGKARARAEHCLALAIYHEARGETVRGQAAVAQVVMNRVFSRFYPGKVCAVVYQNARRRNACQFSFACDGKRKVIKDQDAWSTAETIAKLTLDGKIWEPDIGKATHYHAYWVQPWWVVTMHKLASHGVHTFYRPLRWGDGSDEPDWNTVSRTVLAAVN